MNTKKREDSVLLRALPFNYPSLFVGELRQCSGPMQVGPVQANSPQDLKVELIIHSAAICLSHGEDFPVVSGSTGGFDKFMVKPRIHTSVGPQVNPSVPGASFCCLAGSVVCSTPSLLWSQIL